MAGCGRQMALWFVPHVRSPRVHQAASSPLTPRDYLGSVPGSPQRVRAFVWLSVQEPSVNMWKPGIRAVPCGCHCPCTAWRHRACVTAGGLQTKSCVLCRDNHVWKARTSSCALGSYWAQGLHTAATWDRCRGENSENVRSRVAGTVSCMSVWCADDFGEMAVLLVCVVSSFTPPSRRDEGEIVVKMKQIKEQEMLTSMTPV